MIRFIIDSAHDAAFNMAADQYLLDQCVYAETMFVRFYSWASPTITLGYMQKPDEILNLKSLLEKGVCWIKRPTGGRAVLHHEDLTYSCIFSNSFKFMGLTVQQSYQIITGCLLQGLNSIGVQCEAHDSYDDYAAVKREVKLPCFLAPNRDEIMVEGKKLIGSAQRRTTRGVLQHGSIPFSDKFRNLPDFLNLSEKEISIQKNLLLRKSTCLSEIDQQLNRKDVIDALQHGFKKMLNLPSCVSEWTESEFKEIETIAQSEEFHKQWLS